MKTEEKIYLTKEGYENFLKEIDAIQEQIYSNGRSKSSAYESAVGDGWHDNFEFEQAVREERRLMGLLREKREQLRRIQIIEETHNEELVNIGDFVLCDCIFSPQDIEEKVIHLTGLTSPAFDQDYIEVTVNSPMGKAIQNQPIGSIVKYSVNNNVITLHIKEKVNEKSMER